MRGRKVESFESGQSCCVCCRATDLEDDVTSALADAKLVRSAMAALEVEAERKEVEAERSLTEVRRGSVGAASRFGTFWFSTVIVL